MNCKLVYSESYSDICAVHDALYTYNLTRTGGERQAVCAKRCEHPGAWLVYDSEECLCGGVVWHYDTEQQDFFIDYLYVDGKLRGSGAGGQLLAAVEQTARERGIKTVRVTTNTFQAPEFYRKMGYEEVAVTPAPQPLVPENMHYTFVKKLISEDEN